MDKAYRYCFELTPGYPEHPPNLESYLLYLHSNEDRQLFFNCVYFQSYFTNEIIKAEDGTAYICMRFNGSMVETVEDLQAEPDLLNEIIISPCRIPYLAPLIMEGSKCGLIHKPALHNAVDIIRSSVDTPDIFAVHCLPGKDKTQLIHHLVNFLLHEEDADGHYPGYASMNEYINNLDLKQEKCHALLEKISHELENMKYFIHTPADAQKTLERLLKDSITYISAESLRQWLALIDSIPIQPGKVEAEKRLLKNVYGLPVHPVMYEDNGERTIQEVWKRLDMLSGNPLLVPYANSLAKLSNSFDGSPKWFEQLQIFQQDLMSTLQQVPYIISDEKKNQICSFLVAVHDEVKQWKKHREIEKNRNIVDFCQELSRHPSKYQKYFQPLFSHQPIVIGGICIVDLDLVHNESTLGPLLAKAKQIILFSVKMEGLFRHIYHGARILEEKDGITRTAFLSEYDRHPAITEFILQSFYPEYETTLPEEENMAETGRPSPFTWIEWEGDDSVVIEHMMSFAEQHKNIGIVSMQKDQAITEAIQYFLNRNQECMHLVDVKERQSVFDVVYLWQPENYSQQDLCFAFGKGIESVVAIGSKANLPNRSPLKDFYFRCIGEDVYGRIIG